MEEQTLDPIWKALSDPTRRQLLDLLKERPQTTGDLCAAFPHLTRFAVMKHLGVLEGAGLVVVRRRGRERWNHLNAVPIRAIYERWISPYEATWAGSLLRLKGVTENAVVDSIGTDVHEEEQAVQTMLESPTSQIRRIEIEQDVFIAASPERVFDAMAGDNVGRWWSHSFVPNPEAIRLEPALGGRFYEAWGDDGGALYATVTRIKRGELLMLTGPFGMTGPVQGVIAFTLEAKDGGTLLKLSHHAIGELDDDTESVYSKGWAQLLNHRLKPFVETGTV